MLERQCRSEKLPFQKGSLRPTRKHSNHRKGRKNTTHYKRYKAASSRPVVIDLISSPCNISSENEAIDSTSEM